MGSEMCIRDSSEPTCLIPKPNIKFDKFLFLLASMADIKLSELLSPILSNSTRSSFFKLYISEMFFIKLFSIRLMPVLPPIPSIFIAALLIKCSTSRTICAGQDMFVQYKAASSGFFVVVCRQLGHFSGIEKLISLPVLLEMFDAIT